jgi:hypothetical protein
MEVYFSGDICSWIAFSDDRQRKAAKVPNYVVSNATLVGTERSTLVCCVRRAILLSFFLILK